MEIWLLVIAFLAVAIVLFIASIYAKDSQRLESQLEEIQIQQSKEFFQLKTRISEIEKELQDPQSLIFSQTNATADNQAEVVETVELVDESNISDLTKEEIIRLYSQGFTMQEISKDVALSVTTVQNIVDDYIENR